MDDSLSGKSMLSITHNFHYESYSGVSPVKIGFFFKEISFVDNFHKEILEKIWHLRFM